MPNLKRLKKELDLLRKNPNEEYYSNVGPINGDMYFWTATLRGPENTPYEGGYFNLQMRFDSNYPFSSIKVKFITKIYHPNISDSGEICLDILSYEWSAAFFVSSILVSIVSLLSSPNPDATFKNRAEMGYLYKNDKSTYIKNVGIWTKKYASLHNHNQYMKSLPFLHAHIRHSERIKRKFDEKTYNNI